MEGLLHALYFLAVGAKSGGASAEAFLSAAHTAWTRVDPGSAAAQPQHEQAQQEGAGTLEAEPCGNPPLRASGRVREENTTDLDHCLWLPTALLSLALYCSLWLCFKHR